MSVRGWLPVLALVWLISWLQLAQAAPPTVPLAAAANGTALLRPFDPQDFAKMSRLVPGEGGAGEPSCGGKVETSHSVSPGHRSKKRFAFWRKPSCIGEL